MDVGGEKIDDLLFGVWVVEFLILLFMIILVYLLFFEIFKKKGINLEVFVFLEFD